MHSIDIIADLCSAQRFFYEFFLSEAIERYYLIGSCFNLDRIWLQKRAFELLLHQAEAKKAEIVSLKADIDELNKYLVSQKEPVRSQFEIESLKGENRELANEKYKLEMDLCKSLFLNYFYFFLEKTNKQAQ